MSYLVWLIDDSPHHHAVATATVANVAGVRLKSFFDGATALAAWRIATTYPDAILMDFYLGDTRGDQLTQQLRAREPRGRHVPIIGYSSVASGSAAIVAAGGDLVLRKHGEGVNPSLLAWLQRTVLTSRP